MLWQVLLGCNDKGYLQSVQFVGISEQSLQLESQVKHPLGVGLFKENPVEHDEQVVKLEQE